jgi:hypothetical protein
MPFLRKFILIFSLLFFSSVTSAYAEGDYYNINTTSSDLGSPDAVSWSTGYPITIDQYGKFIVIVQNTSTSQEHFAISNDSGKTWAEIANTTDLFRPSVAYNPIDDNLNIISARDSGVFYKKYSITRDSNNNITNISYDTATGSLTLDQGGSCSGFDARNPIALFKNSGTHGTLVAFWSVTKDCSGTLVTESRGSMRALSNSSSDTNAGSWAALNGSTDSTTGPANVAYNALYSSSSIETPFQQSAMIRGGSGGKANDIYFFNIDENDTHGFRRLAWNSGSSNWSGSWTARATFGGDVDDSHGYSLKKELLSKPVYSSTDDRVYVGIARWLDNTNGDTQSLFYINSSDAVSLAANVYSAMGTHSLYPTFDLAYDSIGSHVYFFYLTSGGSDNGHTYYKTFSSADGLSSAVPFYTVNGETVDIPITYPTNYDDKIQLFFRKNNTVTPGTPPHNIYYGNVNLSDDAPDITGNRIDDSYDDFNMACADYGSATENNFLGGVSILKMNEDFDQVDTPFNNKWSYGTYDPGSYTPNPTGGVVTLGGVNEGNYISGKNSTTYGTLETYAKFTTGNSQHIGWADSTDFNRFAIFSTFNNGQLSARFWNGGAGTNFGLGSSYLNSYHLYKIIWTSTTTTFQIDGTTVYTHSADQISQPMTPIASYDSDNANFLYVDYLYGNFYPATSGTYNGCETNAIRSNAEWTVTNVATVGAGTSYSVQVRTSNDNSTWSAWNTVLSGAVAPTLGRFIDYRINLTGTSTASPTIDTVTFDYSLPTIEFSSTSDSGDESDVNPTIQVNLSNELDEDVTFDYSVSGGTATDTDDYSLSGSSATITAGNTSTTIPLTIVDDSDDESDETVILNISNVTGALVGTDDEFTYTILDNDDAVITPSTNNNDNEDEDENSCDEDADIGKPSIYTIVPKGDDKIQIFFKEGSGDFDKYDLRYGSKSGDLKSEEEGFAEKGDKEYTIKKLDKDTNYYFQVRAKNSCGAKSDWSKEVSAKTEGAIKSSGNKASANITNSVLVPNDVENDYNGNDANTTDEQAQGTPSETADSAGIEELLDEVKIQLIDKNKEPLANIPVELHSDPQFAMTDQFGYVVFKNVEKGNHTLLVTSGQYKTEKQITLDGDDVKRIELTVQLESSNWYKFLYIGLGILIAIIIAGVWYMVFYKPKPSPVRLRNSKIKIKKK